MNIEEVKEHFKNAKIVLIIRGDGETMDMDDGEIKHLEDGYFHLFVNGSHISKSGKSGNLLYDSLEGTFAKIIEYKEIQSYSAIKPERYKSREVNGMDVIDLAEHFKLNPQEFNILKYLLRDKGEDYEDMLKISDYALRESKLIKQRENK
jgi:hypothetical protein